MLDAPLIFAGGDAAHISAIDFDGDGDADLAIARTGVDASLVYQNQGRAIFSTANSELKGSGVRTCYTDNPHSGVGPSLKCYEAGLSDTSIVSMVDYDGDGLLDLYVGNMAIHHNSPGHNQVNYVHNGGRDELYRNNGDGTFTEVWREAFNGQRAPAPTPEDIPTVYGTFKNNVKELWSLSGNVNKVPYEPAVHGYPAISADRATFGIAWGDYDGDGDLDCFLSNYVVFSVLSMDVEGGMSGGLYSSHGRWHQLWENNGDGTFTETEEVPFISCFPDCSTFAISELWPHRNGAPWIGTGTPTGWTTPQFADIDNDGDYDLLLCGISRQDNFWSETNDRTPELWMNNGDKTFAQSTTALVNLNAKHGVCVVGDYDSDGKLDLFVAERSSEHGDPHKVALFKQGNDGVFAEVASANQPFTQADAANRNVNSIALGDYNNDGTHPCPTRPECVACRVPCSIRWPFI